MRGEAQPRRKLLGLAPLELATLVAVVGIAVMWRVSAENRLPSFAEGARPAVIEDWWRYSAGARQGPVDDAVVIVVFSDYLCPACRRADEILTRLVRSHASSVTVVYRHFPFQSEASFQAAHLAECARRAGDFLKVHRELYAHGDSLGLIPWERVLFRAGVGRGESLVACMEQDDVAEAVRRDLAEGAELGVQGTPSLLVDSLFFNGGYPDIGYLDAYVSHVTKPVS